MDTLDTTLVYIKTPTRLLSHSFQLSKVSKMLFGNVFNKASTVSLQIVHHMIIKKYLYIFLLLDISSIIHYIILFNGCT